MKQHVIVNLSQQELCTALVQYVGRQRNLPEGKATETRIALTYEHTIVVTDEFKGVRVEFDYTEDNPIIPD